MQAKQQQLYKTLENNENREKIEHTNEWSYLNIPQNNSDLRNHNKSRRWQHLNNALSSNFIKGTYCVCNGLIIRENILLINSDQEKA